MTNFCVLGSIAAFEVEGLRFQVVRHGAFGIDGYCLFGGRQLRVDIAGLGEEDRLVAKIEWRSAGLD